MRNVNWGSVTATADWGDFKRPAPGGYVARLVSLEDNDAKQYVEAVFDIAEGEFANYYSDDWGQSHPYAHHFFMSYKDTALGMLKGRLEAIQASNPGFDPFAAWMLAVWICSPTVSSASTSKRKSTSTTARSRRTLTSVRLCQFRTYATAR